MRKSSLFLIYALLNAVGFVLLIMAYPLFVREGCAVSRLEGRRLVKELDLTDLCLFTEARYTRHISQADLHSPFQDHPMSIEHFPSGSLVLPPIPTDKASTFGKPPSAEEARS